MLLMVELILVLRVGVVGGWRFKTLLLRAEGGDESV
jgi:hypothetical protein